MRREDRSAAGRSWKQRIIHRQTDRRHRSCDEVEDRPPHRSTNWQRRTVEERPHDGADFHRSRPCRGLCVGAPTVSNEREERSKGHFVSEGLQQRQESRSNIHESHRLLRRLVLHLKDTFPGSTFFNFLSRKTARVEPRHSMWILSCGPNLPSVLRWFLSRSEAL